MGKEAPWDHADKWPQRISRPRPLPGAGGVEAASRDVLRKELTSFLFGLGIQKVEAGSRCKFSCGTRCYFEQTRDLNWTKLGCPKRGCTWAASEPSHSGSGLLCAALMPKVGGCKGCSSAWVSLKSQHAAYMEVAEAAGALRRTQAHGKPELAAELCVGPGISLGTDVANAGANALSAVTVSVR